jgi:hypothetical protein
MASGPGIPTSNILQPGAISQSSQNRQLMVDLQLLTPQYYKQYTEKYGNEDFTWWLAAHAGMEEVKNQNFFWFENRGKLMPAVVNANQVSAPVDTNVTLTLGSEAYFNSGTESPLRVGETLRVASSNIEGKILSIDDSVAYAFTFVVGPLQASQGFTSAGSVYLLAGEVLLFGGDTDAGEASTQINPLIHLDQKYNNNITQIRDGWSNTDLAQMAETYYEYPVSADMAANGVTAFTYKGMYKTLVRFKNNVEAKLMRGNLQTNNTYPMTNSAGAQGIIPKVVADGETVGYTPGNLDIAKLHEITRIMDVNGCAKQSAWLSDVFQKQDFSDGIFAAYPAGAFVYGTGEKSKEASVSYGFQEIYIDGYLLNVKKYSQFNTEVTTGLTPENDYFRNFGLIYPMGETKDARTAQAYKNITIMYQEPPKGGTVGNGIRVWQFGGGSPNPTDGTMTNQIAMITYRSTRVCAANQFIIVQAN